MNVVYGLYVTEDSTERVVSVDISRADFHDRYFNDISGVFRIAPDSAEYKVLKYLYDSWKSDRKPRAVVKKVKEDIASELSLAYSTVTNAFGSLVKKNALIRTDRSMYTLNYNYFFNREAVGGTLRFVLEYCITD